MEFKTALHPSRAGYDEQVFLQVLHLRFVFGTAYKKGDLGICDLHNANSHRAGWLLAPSNM